MFSHEARLKRQALLGLAVPQLDACLCIWRAGIGSDHRIIVIAACPPLMLLVRLSDQFRVDPVNDQFGCADSYYRHVSPPHRTADCDTGQLVSPFPHRTLARILRRPFGIAIELRRHPSIIYGMWGLFVFARCLATISSLGSTTISARSLYRPVLLRPADGHRHTDPSIILRIMVIPFISSVMRDVFEVVPPC